MANASTVDPTTIPPQIYIDLANADTALVQARVAADQAGQAVEVAQAEADQARVQVAVAQDALDKAIAALNAALNPPGP